MLVNQHSKNPANKKDENLDQKTAKRSVEELSTRQNRRVILMS